ncbi:MAG: hypothetical protein J0H55_06955 [Chitinophagaceae bacterium]|nr:hypothetical protein [Chitinophagaceae bacterium]
MKRVTPIFLFPIILSISCTTQRFIYAPSAPNIPYFKEKGDSKISAAYSTRFLRPNHNKTSGVDLQGAYAFTNHWAVVASWFNRSERDLSTLSFDKIKSEIHYKRNIIELGPGYFFPLNRNRSMTLNFYATAGKGKFSLFEKSDSTGIDYSRFHEINVGKYSFQTSLNFIPNEYFHSSFYLKYSFVHYGKYLTDYNPEELLYYGFNKIPGKTIVFPEIGFDLQFGTPEIKGVLLEISGSTLVYKGSQILSTTKLHPRGGNFAIGLTFDFERVFGYK